MPLDFRYHLASLAAVFGALIIGILLGVAMKEGPVLSNQVQELRADYRRSEQLKDIDRLTDQFNARTEHLLVRNRLADRNIALVVNPLQRSSTAVTDVREILEEAGATVTTEIYLKPLLRDATLAQLSAIYAQAAITPLPQNLSAGDLMMRLGGSLGTTDMPVLTALRREKCIKVSGNPQSPISMVVFVGGVSAQENFVRAIDLPFLRGCANRGLITVATESFEAEESAIGGYKKVTTITIDNIDRVAGRISMVLALATGQQGDFGYKPTADDLAPECE